MNDRFNIPLKVGDTVVAATAYGLIAGKIEKFTPNRIAIAIGFNELSYLCPKDVVLFNAQHEFNQINYPETLL